MKGNTSDEGYDSKFPLVPAGTYTMEVIDMDSDVVSSNGNDGFKWKFEVVGGEYAGSYFWDTTWITEDALWRLVMLMKSAGLSDFDFNTDDPDAIWTAIEHKRITAKTYVDPCKDHDGKDRAKIQDFIAVANTTAPPADDSDGNSDEDLY